MHPPLTTVCQPIERLGWMAVEILVDLLNGKTTSQERHETLRTQLVVRQSRGGG